MAQAGPIPEHLDVLIVGAGLSGIGAGVHLTQRRPHDRFLILEGREAIGGTWDLFRYPGIRSDSDMYTLGYSFKPWTQAKAIADGPSILTYVRETAAEHGIDRRVRYGRQVRRASWSSQTATWTVEAEHDGGVERFTCRFLLMCAGYYSYAEGHAPVFEGLGDYKGAFVHPQFWPQELDYAGRRVVVIGSGATAVTLAPAMAKTAAHVTMLQRSPTYVVSRPAEDGFANWLRAKLPAKLAYALIRWRNVLFGMYFFDRARKKPERAKAFILNQVRAELGPDYDVATHFTPRYNPWDQRLCLVPDADLFASIREGRVEVVTDHIDRFTADGVRLQSGRELKADVVVSATGLKLQLAGGVELEVDGAPVKLADRFGYKGMMFSGVPNLASVFGYTNASWTLKADLTCEYVCRLLDHLDRKRRDIAVAEVGEEVAERPWLDFSSGYVQRAAGQLPKQGDRAPWRLHQNYALDMMALRHGRLEDGVMRFGTAGSAAREPQRSAA